MGGILSAEVTLLTSPSSNVFGVQPFRHRILGTINFDCPFLGLHPGIVLSGIGSLFRPAPSPSKSPGPSSDPEDQVKNGSRASSPLRTPLASGQIGSNADLSSGAASVIDQNFPTGASEDQNSTGKDTSSQPLTLSDPNYNPPFPNDIRLPERKGWDNTLHFITKHSHNLTKAATAYVTSHLEFGSCVADYKGLQNRYVKLRPLEDIQTLHEGEGRVRFLNYYTICHGRPKKPKPAAEGEYGLYSGTVDAPNTARRHSENHLQGIQNPSSSTVTTQSPLPSPRISVEEHRDGEVLSETAANIESLRLPGQESLSIDEGIVMSKDKPAETATDRSGSISPALESSHALESSSALESLAELEDSVLTPTTSDESYSLAPLPSFPEAPYQYDPATYPDRESRNIAHRQFSAEFKSYMRALKAYDQAISDRLKSIEKQEKINEKAKKVAKSQGGKKPQPQPQPSTGSALPLTPKSEHIPAATEVSSVPVPVPVQISSEGSSSSHAILSPPLQAEKKSPPKERRFCVLPPRINGQRDPCWVRVFMKDVDEVGAHCGLFVPGEHYAWLVDDVQSRIRGWLG